MRKGVAAFGSRAGEAKLILNISLVRYERNDIGSALFTGRRTVYSNTLCQCHDDGGGELLESAARYSWPVHRFFWSAKKGMEISRIQWHCTVILSTREPNLYVSVPFLILKRHQLLSQVIDRQIVQAHQEQLQDI